MKVRGLSTSTPMSAWIAVPASWSARLGRSITKPICLKTRYNISPTTPRSSRTYCWVAEGGLLHLFADRRRLMHATDSAGREMILSCGAALDHLRVAMAAAGWDTAVDRFPSRNNPDHLVTVHFSALATVSDAERQRADAILRRRTDRLPFAPPRGWDSLESLLRRSVVSDDVTLDVIPDDARPQLAEASRLTETLRRFDPSYQSELRWWTSPFELDQGVPSTARVSASEAAHIDVARAFPLAGQGDRRPALDSDRSKILVMSTHGDTRPAAITVSKVGIADSMSMRSVSAAVIVRSLSRLAAPI
jgi:hypothetical protein